MTNSKELDVDIKEIKISGNLTFSYKEPIEIEKDLECMICLLPLEEPIVEPNCRQMFCIECLTNWSIENSHKGCPFCQRPFNIKTVSLPPKFVTNTLDNLLVYCNTDGCEFNSNSDKNKLIRRCDYRNHFERQCIVVCIDCNQPFTREQLKLHSNECLSKSVKCSSSYLMCPWIGSIKELKQHESFCHYVALSPILNRYNDRITQLEIDNEKTTSFLLEKIKNLESILLTTTTTTTTKMNNYQPTPSAPPSLYYSDTTTTSTIISQLTKKKLSSIEIFKNNSFKYVNGKVEAGIKSVSLGEDFSDSWPIEKGNFPSSVDTLILLDGFKEEVNLIPKSTKIIHMGDIKKPLFSGISVNEIHFHDNCKFKFSKNAIPDSIKIIHFYNVTEPISSESIGKNVKCIHFHDGFQKSLGYGILPSTIQELHLYNIKRQALAIPDSVKTLFLHNEFNHESIELPDQLEFLYLDNIVHPIKSFPSSLKTIHIINYKFEDNFPFPPKTKIIYGCK
ncbi:hypothetical protein RB653_010500 [Dictyostelium firmibasis]|uniref:RING-type domain-containing protein n=1 Tax=Dictyostelium firmibasis TaxID=79012 RepID=A0AAN7TU24_9MYCE